MEAETVQTANSLDLEDAEKTSNIDKDIPSTLEEAYQVLNEADRFYASKRYEEAVEQYSLALEKIVQEHGEMDTKNADIFYAYGRALFHLAVKKSGVFGKAMNSLEDSCESSVPALAQLTDSTRFCFSGDESSDEDALEVLKEDDFSIAWETLDIARILYKKILDSMDDTTEKNVFYNDERVTIQKKLADTYDFLGEISLENENFQQASADFQSSLDLKSQVYPLESSLISEAHYKLALAFEFSQISDLREKAVEHVQWAIKSLEKRIEIEQQNNKGKEKQSNQIDDMQEMLLELRQKVEELQRPLEKTMKILDFQNSEVKSQENMKKTLSEIISNANDLNALVKKKKKVTSNKISATCDENDEINERNIKKVKVHINDEEKIKTY